ncbi:MAG: hypothetical protein M0C28_37565 [Candidatus Moduliflexus flocculans]|nr:hypothetical protein [Candidatus Moduliflexus flocculans]
MSMTGTGRIFCERLSKLLTETQTPCYAWALMSNHAHLLLRTGKVADRSDHAPAFDRLCGELQPAAPPPRASFSKPLQIHSLRRRPRICEQLVAYIHLNPLRAGIGEGCGGVEDVSLSRAIAP